MKIDFPSAQDIPLLRALWKEAFADEDAFLDSFFSGAFSCSRCRAIFSQGKPVAALYWFDCQCGNDKMAYLYAVATAKSHRRQGLCRQLLLDTHTLLKGLGYDGCILVPAEEALAGMYQTMDYRFFAGMDTVAVTAATPIIIEKISASAYENLRRTYLPCRGVIQSGMHFLSGFVSFYRGSDCIFAVAEQAGTLVILELLGNPDSAPGIVAAFGKESGHCRIPGNTPFAMYHSLTGAPAPDYFAFDFS